MNEGIETPNEQVTGVVDDPEKVGEIAAKLTAAGFSKDDLSCAAGDEALAWVDVHGLSHGLLGRLTRFVQHYGEEATEHHAADAEVRAGHVLIAVSVKDDPQKQRAAKVLGEQGVRRLRYWGPHTIETLSQ